MNLHRHGEIVIKPVSAIPAGAKLVESAKSLIVGHSETGHHHSLTLDKVSNAVIKMFEFEGKTYLDIPLQAKLEHQKQGEEIHKTQTITPGIYERFVKQSYSYASKIMRRTLD